MAPTWKDKNSYPKDTDGDKVPDENSPDGKYQGDIDRDDDGLLNTIEIQLGSNPTNSTDTRKIYLGGNPAFLVDVSQDGIYDIIYDPASETIRAVEYADGTYRIDANGDGSWDYLYHTTDDSVTSYQESYITLPLTLLLIGIILALLAVGIFSYIKTRSSYPKKLRRQLKKPLPSISPIDSGTQDMVTETLYSTLPHPTRCQYIHKNTQSNRETNPHSIIKTGTRATPWKRNRSKEI